MKTLRHLLAAIALTCVLSISVMAGDMDTGVAVRGDMGTPLTAAGDMGTGKAATATATSSADPITEIALNLLQRVLALF